MHSSFIMALYMCIQYNYQQQKGHSLERIPLTKAHHLISASEVTTVWHYRNETFIIIIIIMNGQATTVNFEFGD